MIFYVASSLAVLFTVTLAFWCLMYNCVYAVTNYGIVKWWFPFFFWSFITFFWTILLAFGIYRHWDVIIMAAMGS